jgi:flagellar basal body-associated protein FliL
MISYMLLGFLLLIIIVGVLILAIMGLGWQTFFGGVQKGAEKVGITKAIKNITTGIQNSLGNIVSNTTKNVAIKDILIPKN